MGKLHYDGASIDIDDRVLAHLQIVIVNRLRRKEGFPMSWLNTLAMGDGRDRCGSTTPSRCASRSQGRRRHTSTLPGSPHSSSPRPALLACWSSGRTAG